ncbi:murein L,D-transpeptidase catalytic domain-containing protein [Chryseobacterium paridis]|uniref:Murein L,D-transpeptidase catalytic domain family protein n=1 Tax=Chryseobacterium paridis TaxID=2800328 RepID=A0ABS1FVA9_9FLAO|nr:murein L,D-transpeptidase catalytic domain family protein [Chryseobacterium paridis]MBK1896378.1 murein L,D-transpeptidase catalytic domain family protein [Chryseobacterium paridis]
MQKALFFFLIIFFSFSLKAQGNTNLPESRINELKAFLKGKNYNQDIAVFINFKTFSGKYRYFVYDLKNDKILQKAIVAHGSGSVKKNSDELIFSNVEGAYQSSLGKYEIKESYSGKFGKSYRLNGLDSTNNNAKQRAIVIHSYGCIPDKESVRPACLSLGCPMLSSSALEQTAGYIDSSKQSVILYAFY